MGNRRKYLFQYLYLIIKVIFFFWILFPILFIFYVVSRIRSMIFLKKERLLTYLNNHINKIDGLGDSRISGLEIERVSKGISNLVWKQTLSFDGTKKITLVGKKFLPFCSVITFISSYLGPWPKDVPLSTKNRFRREVYALGSLSRDRVDIPRMLFVDDRERLILMNYIPGTDLGDFLEQVETDKEVDSYSIDCFRNCGRGLAMLHRCGMSLISHNDRSRILTQDGRVYLVDFELSSSNHYRPWDLAIFIHWMRIKLGFAQEQKIESLKEAFISGYRELEPLNKGAVDRYLDSLQVYVPFAKICLWINRKLRRRSVGELKCLT
jgi:tRNA A-37 threonylcarbamoyl transferase component Bud32